MLKYSPWQREFEYSIRKFYSPISRGELGDLVVKGRKNPDGTLTPVLADYVRRGQRRPYAAVTSSRRSDQILTSNEEKGPCYGSPRAAMAQTQNAPTTSYSALQILKAFAYIYELPGVLLLDCQDAR